MRITVIGAGSFGTALAIVLAENNHDVTMWSHAADTAEAINNNENTIYLPGIKLPQNITATTDLEQAIPDAELLVSVVPTQATREVWQKVNPLLNDHALIVAASKGIEKKSLKLVNELLLETIINGGRYSSQNIKERLFFISGPSFAKEIASRIPTAVTIAGYNYNGIPALQKIFTTPFFRVYGSHDVTGIELGGALKNIIAIATGIADGLGMGHNTRAAIITRGLAEIARLGKALGCDPLTFMGLAGMGDLVLTCTGDLSRNRTVGLKLGAGQKLDQILSEMRMVAEGVPTTASAWELARNKNVEMPITEAVHQILYEHKPPSDTLQELMGRRLKFESH